MSTVFFRLLAVAIVSLGLAAPVAAEFVPVRNGTEFTKLIEDKRLTRMGIKLTVTPSGDIEGRAFGRPVTGDWSWRDGYFCRDLYWGETELGYNCQMVARSGSALRFISDRGQGQSADLYLR